MQASVKWVSGLTFVSKGESGHSIVMDYASTREEQTASSPTELLLQALCGCTAMDVISILKKMKEPVEGFEVKAEGIRATEHPKVITDIKLEYIVKGNINHENFDKAVSLSQEKYCNISIILKRGGVRFEVIKTVQQQD